MVYYVGVGYQGARSAGARLVWGVGPLAIVAGRDQKCVVTVEGQTCEKFWSARLARVAGAANSHDDADGTNQV